ncbi:hypothetical protein BC830DRAFT_232331 [Chytriomyces sp. MP71]|nr:hypothetical protein BC830DRAFT_232331 [Chytriomyces sp. MP71]
MPSFHLLKIRIFIISIFPCRERCHQNSCLCLPPHILYRFSFRSILCLLQPLPSPRVRNKKSYHLLFVCLLHKDGRSSPKHKQSAASLTSSGIHPKRCRIQDVQETLLNVLMDPLNTDCVIDSQGIGGSIRIREAHEKVRLLGYTN